MAVSPPEAAPEIAWMRATPELLAGEEGRDGDAVPRLRFHRVDAVRVSS